MISMLFSFCNILTSAIQINIFIVYIGQFRNLDSLRRFVTLTLGHLPFFIHSVLSRILAIAFIFVYLHEWGAIPVAAIFAANLLIGYLKLGDQRFSRDVSQHLSQRVKSRLFKAGVGGDGINAGRVADPDQCGSVLIDLLEVDPYLEYFLDPKSAVRIGFNFETGQKY
jgi:hypothetical protein